MQGTFDSWVSPWGIKRRTEALRGYCEDSGSGSLLYGVGGIFLRVWIGVGLTSVTKRGVASDGWVPRLIDFG